MLKRFMLILCFAPTAALADIVALHNGDRLSGTVMDMTQPDGLHFRASFGQQMLIPWGDVADVRNAAALPLPVYAPYQQQAGNVFLTRPAAPQGTKQATRQAAPQVNPAQTVVPQPLAAPAPAPAPEATEPEDKSGWLGALWSGRINAGASLQEGNTEKETLALDGTAKAKWDNHRATIAAEYDYEEDAGAVTEDEQSLDLAYDYFYTEKWFINSHVNFEMDELSNIDLRSEYGVGLGYQPYESDDLNLQLIAGPSYITDDFTNGRSEDDMTIGWSVDYDQRFWEKAFQIFHNHNLDVPADDTDAYLFESKTGIRLPIKGGIVGTAEIDYDWDNAPAAGVTEGDTKYSLKLGYEW